MYPIRYEADFVEPQNRAKAFFRWILLIPWAIIASIYGIGAQIVAVIAWFALLFTGRYPRQLYDFQAGFLRFIGRFLGFAYLQTEEWPPFGMDDDRSYPVRVEVDPPLEHYNRWKTGFRLIVGIPVLFMASYVMPYFALVGAFAAWLHIVFMGRTSGGVHNTITVGNAYALRALGYFLLVTETFPPVSDQQPAANVAAVSPATRKALARGAEAKTTAAMATAGPRAAATPKPKAKAKPKAAAKAKPKAKAAAKRSSAAKPRSKPKPAARRKPTGGNA